MESQEQRRRWFFHRCRTSGDMKGVSILVAFLLGVWGAQALEMSVGKVTTIEAMNGSSVRLPCFYSSCVGVENMAFYWIFNNSNEVMRGLIPVDGVEPHLYIYWYWQWKVEFVGNTKTKDLSIMLHNISWLDEAFSEILVIVMGAGDYTCLGTIPKEKDREHTASLTLKVVDQLTEEDNTLTVVMSVVGAVIGLLVVIKAVKSLVTRFVLDKNKEPLVSSTGNDDTENDLSGSKADDKLEPKA